MMTKHLAGPVKMVCVGGNEMFSQEKGSVW